MDIKKLIQTYLAEARMLHLATSANGRPWACNVWFAADDSLNIYWLSGRTRRHTLEIAQNPAVAGGITVGQTPEGKPRGLQFEGTAKKLTIPADIDRAVSLYRDRIFPETKIRELMASATNPNDFYQVKPARFVLFDTVNFPSDPFQEFTPE